MSKDYSYPIRSLKWHAARFFAHPDKKQHSTNGSLFLATCLLTAATTGFIAIDESPSDTSVLDNNTQVVERYQKSIDHISEQYQEFYTQNAIETQNMLPGTESVSAPDEDAIDENKLKTDAINFLTATLTDATLSESDVQALLTDFSHNISPIGEFGFSSLDETSFLDEAQQHYKDKHDTQNIHTPQAAKAIAQTASEMNDKNQLHKLIGTLAGGLGGGFSLFIILASMIFAGQNKERYKTIAAQPKPTRQAGHKH